MTDWANHYVHDNLEKSAKRYKSAYNILMEYWDYYPDDKKAEIHKRLQGLGL